MKVLVQSFSFNRTGYPEDRTGKGGGFVFDCRAIDAYDSDHPFPYMHLTGLDFKVVTALDNDAKTQLFFGYVWGLVCLDIDKCIKRNIPVMTVNFGCTAGQHRSVYMAERLNRKIRTSIPNVEVELNHLERAHWPPRN